ncbi:restriction endonuclease [Thioalkalivibrio paradoxus]|uniref:Restriction endonuclease n=1 Tax=Thioalkalivibrio paradoxus ARh 1 TaxID=713585 RepID=W0DNY2_9GAMM|nr:restriction endonuclease [Thioalkalivibrio paradoxus]AHE98972.1 restriction endonuclease [Thioalkalivibrio paradoxus ARh 1]
MPIPDFQAIMLPLLELAADGQTRSLAESREGLAEHFGLSLEEREELLPSGTQPVFNNRVAWASVYLQRAGLLQRPRRGHYRITDQGREVLRSRPARIDIKFLQRYPAFHEFQRAKGKPATSKAVDGETPEETLEAAYQRMRDSLAAEIIEQIMSCSPQFFERLVVELLVNMGYGGTVRDAGMAIGKGGDEGIDGIIKEDRLGLDVIYLQAKRWDGPVGRPEVQKFVGALHGKHARKGVFITTSSFTQNATDYAAGIDPKVVLIDGKRLAHLMIDFDVGVATRAEYHVKRIDGDYFSEE